MYFRVMQDYERDTIDRYAPAETISMVDGIAGYLFETDALRDDFTETIDDGVYYDYCTFTAEDAVTAAEYNGVARVADLEIKAYPRRKRSTR